MTIRVTEDEDELGGHALVDLGRPSPSPLLSFRRQDAEPRHLGSEGWQPEVAWLAPLSATERGGCTVMRFGPNVVDRIEELVPVEIVAQDGTSFGVISWPFITAAPSGNGLLAGPSGSIPSLVQAVTPALPTLESAADVLPIAAPEPKAFEALASTVTAAPMSPPPPVTGSRRGGGRSLWILLALLILGGGGAAAILYRDTLGDLARTRLLSRETAQAPVASPVPATAPAPVPSPDVQRLSVAELRQRHTRLLDDRAATEAFMSLGETALTSRQGGAAFRAFEEADPITNADAAWQLARFYDPRNAENAYRDAAQPSVIRAAYYYALWRNRSARHTDELRGLCEANAELVARDDRLRTMCRS